MMIIETEQEAFWQGAFGNEYVAGVTQLRAQVIDF